MAFKPSSRRQSAYAEAELEIRPIMNLMVCLIPLLLAGAQFIKNTQLDLNLPPSKGGGASNDEPKDEKEEKKLELNLTIGVTDEGFYIMAKNVNMYNADKPEAPTVPILEKDSEGKSVYDFLGLRQKLKDLKKEIADKNFADADKIIITMGPKVPYEVFIETQDAISGELVNGNIVDIFPVVQIGKII